MCTWHGHGTVVSFENFQYDWVTEKQPLGEHDVTRFGFKCVSYGYPILHSTTWLSLVRIAGLHEARKTRLSWMLCEQYISFMLEIIGWRLSPGCRRVILNIKLIYCFQIEISPKTQQHIWRGTRPTPLHHQRTVDWYKPSMIILSMCASMIPWILFITNMKRLNASY